MTVHFERAGKPFSMLLDLVEVAESHTGVNLGIAFANVLKAFGIEEKVRASNSYQRRATHLLDVLQILSITGDNASNNDAMIRHLSTSLSEFPGPANQTRCFVHTVNLIAKSVLKPFDLRKKKDIRAFNKMAHALADDEDGEEKDEDKDKDEEKDEDEEDDEEDNELDTSLEPIRSMLLKVRLRFVPYSTAQLTNVEHSLNLSYGKLHSRSRTRQLSSCRPGTRCSPPMASPHV